MGRVVLVTGASRFLGRELARLLAADDAVDRVMGVDIVPPPMPIEGFEFTRGDIRSPIIARLLIDAAVDCVVHMGVIATPKQAGGRSTMKEINVIGTMQLLAACQRAESVRTLVVKSTAGVYGCGPKDPALFAEGMEPAHPPRSGWAKDCAEVEGYVRGFARRRPDVSVTTLRFANIIGPRIQTGMTAYFKLPVIPTVLGFDPRLQFTHEHDALDVLHQAAHAGQMGTFNVAGSGVLMLSQAIRRAGGVPLPIPAPLYSAVARGLDGSGQADFSSEQVRYLTYGRALDTSRAVRQLGFVPSFTTSEAFDDFLGVDDREGAHA